MRPIPHFLHSVQDSGFKIQGSGFSLLEHCHKFFNVGHRYAYRYWQRDRHIHTYIDRETERHRETYIYRETEIDMYWQADADTGTDTDVQTMSDTDVHTMSLLLSLLLDAVQTMSDTDVHTMSVPWCIYYVPSVQRALLSLKPKPKTQNTIQPQNREHFWELCLSPCPSLYRLL